MSQRIPTPATAIALIAVIAVLATACGPQSGSGPEVAGDSSTPAPATADTATPDASAETLVSGIEADGFDRSVRPQDDLYTFANGTWLEQTEIPADKSRYGTFLVLADKTEEDVRKLVEEVSNADAVEPGSPAQKIRDFFNAYMDAETADQLGEKPIEPDLERIAAAQTHADIVRLFGELGTDGINNPIGLFIFSDFQDANTNVVYVAQNGLTLPDRDYYLKDDEQYAQGRQLMQDYAERLFTLAGLDGADSIGKELLALETRLAEVQWTREQNRDRASQYNPHSSDELENLAPEIDWEGFFEASRLPERDTYIVMQPSFFEAADDIISDTPVETWKNYLTFQLLSGYAPVLGETYFSAWFDMYRKGLRGVEQARPRWKRAIASINGNMGELLGQLYVERHFTPEAKARMQELIDNLIEAYRQSITDLEWMSEETKQEALAKLARFNSKVGYPDEWRDYSALEIRPGDLVGNLKRATAFEYQRNLNKLDRPVDKSEWLMTPQTINAYYLPMWNEIVFPASILQPPYFNLAADDAVNYGAIGAVIGHEIGHGFDDQGRKFDGDGNLRDWWTPEDNARFLERKDKLAAQYDAYEVIDGLTINGQYTSGENIGDLGGLSIAYKAYQLSLDGAEAPVIDGWTGDQRFFLGWARAWREKRRPEEEKRLLTIDTHSPTKFRANGAAVNVPAFYEAFDVKEGDGMYLPPEDRVKIW
ncbi:M13 family metallopeptidase [Elongatibacter sediminis]|uniref:M13 family metallopeptidase n=1 Tax=Elongatibacter sediminis TaxID=3119006 RepID=A0AAW9R978_9GAMM